MTSQAEATPATGTSQAAATPSPAPATPTASAVPLCGLIVALLIFAQFPILFGMDTGTGSIWIFPWVLVSYPVLVYCIIKMFKDGQLADATINGVLSVILMGQNMGSAIIYLTYSANGMAVPPEVLAGMAHINGFAFLLGGCILLIPSIITFKESKVGGLCLFACTAALFFLFLMFFGFISGPLTLVPGIGFGIIAVYLFYTSMKALV
jgi:hypothetical protein